jgi:hypothetical protein
LLPRVGKQIAMYGPWIYDIGHCDHPEIHPAEQIWWTEDAPDNGMVYHLSVVADASKRFLWRSQMDDGTKLHPWGAPPITGLFAIAFEVPVDTVRVGTTGQRFDVGNVDLRNAASVPGSSQAHNLVYQGQTLVSFIPHNDSFKVSFENVGLKTGGISLNTGAVVRGFLVIETTVGTVKQIATRVPLLEGTQPIFVDVPLGSDPDKVDQRIEQKAFQKEDGHNVFTLTRTSGRGIFVR